MEVAQDFQQAESNVQRGLAGDDQEQIQRIFKALDDRIEELSICMTRATELKNPAEDPMIFSDGTCDR